MIVIETKHVNSDGEINEGDVIKFKNDDSVFFIVERTLITHCTIESEERFVEEYIARKLSGNDVNNLLYDSNNETKRFSFPSANAPMKVDHVFIVGKMFKSYS